MARKNLHPTARAALAHKFTVPDALRDHFDAITDSAAVEHVAARGGSFVSDPTTLARAAAVDWLPYPDANTNRPDEWGDARVALAGELRAQIIAEGLDRALAIHDARLALARAAHEVVAVAAANAQREAADQTDDVLGVPLDRAAYGPVARESVFPGFNDLYGGPWAVRTAPVVAALIQSEVARLLLEHDPALAKAVRAQAESLVASNAAHLKR